MAPAEDAAAPVGRRGWRRLWATVLRFASRRARGEEALVAGTQWAGLRQRKRTVPVDVEPVVRPAGREVMRRRAGQEEEAGKGPRVRGCCFLPPARVPGRKHSTMDSSGTAGIHNKQRQLEHTKQQQQQPRSQDATCRPSEPPPARQFRSTAGNNGSQPRADPTRTPPTTPRDTAHENEASAREPRTKASAGVGAFGHAVGLSVVAAVSMAGLLGGRLLAVACVCAWLVALSRLRRREATVSGGTAGSVAECASAIDVNSPDYKKLVVLRGLLERDRAKAATE